MYRSWCTGAGTHIHIFKSLKLEGSYIEDLSVFFLDDVVRSGHLFLQTTVMFMLKVFIGIFYLINYCGNIAKFLSTLFSWTYSFMTPKNSHFSLGLCVSHQCCLSGVVNTPSSLTSIWPGCTSLEVRSAMWLSLASEMWVGGGMSLPGGSFRSQQSIPHFILLIVLMMGQSEASISPRSLSNFCE